MTSFPDLAPDSGQPAFSLPVRLPAEAASPVTLEDYKAALHGARLTLARDLLWLERSSLGRLIFGEVTGAYGPALSRLFDTWPAPSAAALALFAAGRLGIAPEHHLFPALIGAALLADVENPLPYHGNDHYKKVLLQTLRLIATQNAPGLAPPFTQQQTMLLMIAACIHDLGHDGRGNGGVRYRLERAALDAARPYLEAAGLAEGDWRDLEVMILCTDIAAAEGAASPAQLLRACHRHFAEGAALPDLPPELARLAGRADLARMAMVLATADIATSAGLSFSEGWKQTQLLSDESGIAALRTVRAFYGFVSGEIGRTVLMTQAGAEIYGPGFAAIERECRARLALEGTDMLGPEAKADKAGREAA
jgi:hypothetical protein